MKTFTNNHEQYKNLLCEALKLFYMNDAKDLFKEKRKPRKNANVENEREKVRQIVNECAMSGCVYRYMWCLMRQNGSFPMSNIDIEYDRMVKDSQSYYEKELSCECRSREGNKLCYDKCCQIIIDEIEKGVAKNSTKKEKESDIIRKAVRPDVIVHNRNKVGVENNGLVVEFKKYDNNKVAFDMAKLYYFTCPESKTLQYQLGAMVRLFPEYAYVGFVGERKILSGCKVCANRVEAVKRDEIEKCLLERVI